MIWEQNETTLKTTQSLLLLWWWWWWRRIEQKKFFFGNFFFSLSHIESEHNFEWLYIIMIIHLNNNNLYFRLCWRKNHKKRLDYLFLSSICTSDSNLPLIRSLSLSLAVSSGRWFNNDRKVVQFTSFFLAFRCRFQEDEYLQIRRKVLFDQMLQVHCGAASFTVAKNIVKIKSQLREICLPNFEFYKLKYGFFHTFQVSTRRNFWAFDSDRRKHKQKQHQRIPSHLISRAKTKCCGKSHFVWKTISEVWKCI